MRNLLFSALAATALLCLLLFTGVVNARGSDQFILNSITSSNTRQAPDFILQDLNGKARSLKDFRGKVVLLNFTTTWCPHCKKDIPNLKRLHASMKGKDFELISIFVNESPKRVAIFSEKYALPYTVLVDSEAMVARHYGVRGVPMKVVVDRNGGVGCYQCDDAEDTVVELLKLK